MNEPSPLDRIAAARSRFSFDDEDEEPADEPISQRTISLFSLMILLIALAVGIGARTFGLDSVPPGLNQDEACNGYDAYSLLRTGRDHRGNPFPIAIQAFNDYRMPLFDYSLVPLIAEFGLKTEIVRLGAALWGSLDLILLAVIAGLMVGIRGSAVAVLVAMFSPWHLPLSRFGHEAITASAMVSAAMACFYAFLRTRDGDWLIVSALPFVISLYAYSTTKAFLPLMITFLAIVYWSEIKPVRRQALIALAIILIGALPQLLLLYAHSAEMEARFNQVSIFSNAAPMEVVRGFASGWAKHFSPDFLFIEGQEFITTHPPGFGQLLFAQALMVFTAVVALIDRGYRKHVFALLGWVAIAAVPAAFTLPAPHALRDVLAIAPWTLLSAVGMVFMLDLPLGNAALRYATASLIVIGLLAEGGAMVSYYFQDYPKVAAPFFTYGMREALAEVSYLSHGHEPVVITDEINQPYIFVLFYGQYPPALFQGEQVKRAPWIFGPVESFDRYRFTNPLRVFRQYRHGIFVLTGDNRPPAPTRFEVHYPDGKVAYRVLSK